MTNPKHSRIVMLAEEALTTEWLSEGTILEHVRRHERTDVASSDVAFALRELKRTGRVEGRMFDGYLTKFWRRLLRLREAA